MGIASPSFLQEPRSKYLLRFFLDHASQTEYLIRRKDHAFATQLGTSLIRILPINTPIVPVLLKTVSLKARSICQHSFAASRNFLQVGLRTGLIKSSQTKLSRISNSPKVFSTAVPSISILPPVPASMSDPSLWSVLLVADIIPHNLDIRVKDLSPHPSIFNTWHSELNG